jgi:hypothetical protein
VPDPVAVKYSESRGGNRMHWLGDLEENVEQASDVLASFHFSVAGREINERIEAVTSIVPRGRKLSLICECGDGDCEEQVEISPEQYQQIRRKLQTFIVAPGHESADSDRVVKSTKGWLLIEKSAHHGGLFDPERRRAPSHGTVRQDDTA